MGIAKRLWLEEEERLWVDQGTFVCAECVEDDFLRALVAANANAAECSYCHRNAEELIAAPFGVLMEPIAGAIFEEFNDPVVANVPYDGGLVDEGFPTDEMLEQLGWEANPRLLGAVAASLKNQMWVQAPGGMWMGSTENEMYLDAWQRFAQIVKHSTRYFFSRTAATEHDGTDAFAPLNILPKVAEFAHSLRLLETIAPDTALYRVRKTPADPEWRAAAKTMGPPPSAACSAGRMNPAGIRYFYLAFEPATAIAELSGPAPLNLTLATFTTARPITVLNLVNLPRLPSMFDAAKRRDREAILFLHSFANEISQPVTKDGREHIDYVPSQVMSEFFAQVYQLPGEPPRKLDGIIYRSAVRPGGKNVVFFPMDRMGEASFDQVVFRASRNCVFATDAEMMAAMA